ncbi:hypothetical protein V8E51_018890 [Hyaloscypha variabilis]
MTIIHIVLFKFLPSTTSSQKSCFLTAIKSLKSLPCVLDNRLIVGGPSVTDPIGKSKGFEYALGRERLYISLQRGYYEI